MKALRGIAVSPGYANGRVVVYRPPELDAVQRHPIQPKEAEEEFNRFIAAQDHAVEELTVVRQQVAADVGESEAAIFDAHIAILSDPALKKNIREQLNSKQICVEAVLADEVETFAKQLASSDCAYMRELAVDARDVGNRLLRHLRLDEGQSPLAKLEPGSVIIARDLMPSETVCIDRRHITGIATENGGPTSHTAILARSLGIPATTGLSGLLDHAQPEAPCLLDGARGTLVLNPSDSQRRRFSGRRREFEQSQELMRRMESKVCRLKNGTRIKLMANINQSSDVDLANEHNLDGIGLFRTELMYLSAHEVPSSAVQSRHYSQTAQACPSHPVTIRTFDFSLDKHPPFLSLDASDALELRGLRFALRRPRLFKSQLRAIIRSARSFPNIRILFPMVTGWWELNEALEMVKTISKATNLERAIQVGAMIETPAAIFALPEIIKRVDFISIGCNDLAQYTLAMERSSTSQTLYENIMHPALIRAIQQIAQTANDADCPVCACGEAASDPLVAAVFTGLGIRELSVSPARAPVIRYALRHLSLADAKKIAACVMSSDPGEVHQKLKHTLPEDLRQVLSLEPEA